MLAITVEVWPGGDVRRRQVIHTVACSNISNLSEISDYEVFIDGVRVPNIEGHERDRGALVLLTKALQQAGYCDA